MTTSAPITELPPAYLEEYNGGALVAAVSVILTLSTVLLALRVYARTLTKAGLGWDDVMLPVSWLLLIGLAATCLVSIPLSGTGHHTAAVEHQELDLHKLIYILTWFYVPTNCLSRASIVLLYLRVFVRKSARMFAWVVLAFLVANAISALIASQLECIPLAYAWDKTIENGRCFNAVLWWRVANIPNIIGDVAIMALPIETVWTLQASTARKTGIAVVFLTGSIGLVASSVRTSQFFTANFADPVWVLSGLLSWTMVESGMYFCAACLVGLRPLLRKVSEWVHGTARSSSYRVRQTFEQREMANGKHRRDIAALRRSGGGYRLGSLDENRLLHSGGMAREIDAV